jgi:hypothetical protein
VKAPTSPEPPPDRGEAEARFASQFIRPMLAIGDACGLQGAMHNLRPKTVIGLQNELSSPADGDREHAQRASENASRPDLVVAFDVMDRFPDPVAVLRRLGALGLPVLCSYRLASDTGTQEGRTPGAFENLCRTANLPIVWRYFHQDFAIHMLAPPRHDVTRVTTVGYREPGDLVTTSASDRPSLLVAGFYGRGNCGDEALLQVIYERLSTDFEIIVSLDEHGAVPGYWDWYPYDRCRRIHQGNLSDPARACSGMIVGGGGLPVGFVADQVFAARSAGLPIALAGTDFPIVSQQTPLAKTVALDYLKSFDVVALRSAAAVERARRVGHAAIHGADWALCLATDESDAFQWSANRALIVLREFPLQAVSFRYVEEITRLIGRLREARLVPTLLPFCPEDDRFATALGLDLFAPTERHWWNPRRMKQLIALSGLLISVGRLHPMIFAAGTRTSVIQLCPPLADNMDCHAFGKISAMSKELDVDYLPAVDTVCEHLRLGRSRPSGKAELEASQQRLEDMIDQLRRLFTSPGRRRPS